MTAPKRNRKKKRDPAETPGEKIIKAFLAATPEEQLAMLAKEQLAMLANEGGDPAAATPELPDGMLKMTSGPGSPSKAGTTCSTASRRFCRASLPIPQIMRVLLMSCGLSTRI